MKRPESTDASSKSLMDKIMTYEEYLVTLTQVKDQNLLVDELERTLYSNNTKKRICKKRVRYTNDQINLLENEY